MNCDHPRPWRVFYRRTEPHTDVCGRCGVVMPDVKVDAGQRLLGSTSTVAGHEADALISQRDEPNIDLNP